MGSASEVTLDIFLAEARIADRERERELQKVGISHHQVAILQWIANGKRNEDIALLMNLARPQTVQAHVQRIMDATGTNSRTAAVVWALRKGIIK